MKIGKQAISIVCFDGKGSHFLLRFFKFLMVMLATKTTQDFIWDKDIQILGEWNIKAGS